MNSICFTRIEIKSAGLQQVITGVAVSTIHKMPGINIFHTVLNTTQINPAWLMFAQSGLFNILFDNIVSMNYVKNIKNSVIGHQVIKPSFVFLKGLETLITTACLVN